MIMDKIEKTEIIAVKNANVERKLYFHISAEINNAGILDISSWARIGGSGSNQSKYSSGGDAGETPKTSIYNFDGKISYEYKDYRGHTAKGLMQWKNEIIKILQHEIDLSVENINKI